MTSTWFQHAGDGLATSNLLRCFKEDRIVHDRSRITEIRQYCGRQPRHTRASLQVGMLEKAILNSQRVTVQGFQVGSEMKCTGGPAPVLPTNTFGGRLAHSQR